MAEIHLTKDVKTGGNRAILNDNQPNQINSRKHSQAVCR